MCKLLPLLPACRATSNKIAWEWVTSTGPKVHWVRSARWVHDGPFLTSSGVTAGTDMAVYVLKTQLGSQVAGASAKYNEYLPNTDAEVDPFAEPSFVPDV
jgi:transcriptional regulator GlxA family with amidase domain